MGYKYVKIDEKGKKLNTHQYDEGAVSYATEKYKDSLLGEYGTRTMSYGKGRNRKNFFDIQDDRSRGVFTVSWKNVHISPRPEQSIKQENGELVILDYRSDMIINIELGEFQGLQDAELFTIKFALAFGNVKPYFGYHPLFEKENITIEDIPSVFNWDDEIVHLQMKCPTVDKKILEQNKEETRRRLELREKIKNGGEDTRIMVKVLLNVDLGDLAEAIQNKLSEEIDQIDAVGADGTSIYNVDDVVVDVKNTGEVEATFYLERESGKFASADELRQSIADSIGDTEIELPITVTE